MAGSAGVTGRSGCTEAGPCVHGEGRDPQGAPGGGTQHRKACPMGYRLYPMSTEKPVKGQARRWQKCAESVIYKEHSERARKCRAHWLRPLEKQATYGFKKPPPYPKDGRWQLPLSLSGGIDSSSCTVPCCACKAAHTSLRHTGPLVPTTTLGSGVIIPPKRQGS